MSAQPAIKLTPEPRKARKPAAKRVKVPANDRLYAYANSGVILMAFLSAVLNGYANSLHATIAWAGWAMGLVVPVIILILGKVGSLLHKRGQRRAAYATGGVGIGLLALSVWHVSMSIALLTGSSTWLALPMAIAIDCGFVACEVAALLD